MLKRMVEELVATNIIVILCALVAGAAFLLHELVIGSVMVLICLFYTTNLAICFFRFKRESFPLLESHSLDELRLLIASSKSNFAAEDFPQRSVSPLVTPSQVEFAAHKSLDAWPVVAFATNFAVFRSKTSSHLGSELLELEDELRIFDDSGKPILVISEFRGRKALSKTLQDHLVEPAAVSLRELICYNIYEKVDLIPHCGEGVYQLTDELVSFIGNLRDRYKHVLIWLPENQYASWKLVADRINQQGVANRPKWDSRVENQI
jgi:hypothetical protein